MKKPTVLQAPVSLTGLFVTGDESGDEDNNDGFENETEVVGMNLGGINVEVRQMTWHKANANQVWPGTFTLVHHMLSAVNEFGVGRYENKKLLELGSATGALAIALLKTGKYDIITWYVLAIDIQK
jgi:hypothetical protein